MPRGQLQTMRRAFQQICAGEREWTALGNFMNYWYAYAKEQREALVAEPLPAYDRDNETLHRWATFCAAAVEWFCHRYGVTCPAWIFVSHYQLPTPWYFAAQGEEDEAWLRQTTPEAFARRNIYCGAECFANKWELTWPKRNQNVLPR